jgi:predicted Zn finger-like uncharacterized protein
MARSRVICPNCQKQYQVDDSLLGKRARCAHCKTSFIMPTKEALAATRSSPWPWVVGNTAAGPPATVVAAEGKGREPAEDGVPEIWEPGDVLLDLYEVREVFTSGGMGLVYRVRHRGWNVDLAVKCPRLEYFRNDQDKENFEQEAETWVKLGLHAHTVACYYVRQMGGIPRVFAEFVGGGSLAEWIRTRKLYAGGPARALERILDVAIQFAWGLQHAHEQGLVHRDVKPGNLLMTAGGTAKVTDFGMARARGATAEAARVEGQRSVLVSSGGMTPAFCSPEQVLGQPVSRKTDIWSWGVSVLEMFTGPATWSAGYLAAEVLRDYLSRGPVEKWLPHMPPELAELLGHCFRRDQDARPGDMLEIVTDLLAIYRQSAGGDYPRAAPLAADALADSLNNRAVSLLDLNKQAEAEQLWEEALAAGPDHPESTYNLGLSRWRAGRLTGAALLQKLQEVCASHPGRWLPLYLLAQAELEQGDWAAAVTALEQIGGDGAGLEEVRTALAAAREQLANPGQRLRVLEGHTDWVSSLWLSSGGRFALSGSADKTLRLWEVASGKCLRLFQGHTEWVTAVCLSRDGRQALSGSADKTLRLWEVVSGKCLSTFGEHTKWVAAVALCPDGRHALSAGGDGLLNLWELAKGGCVRSFDGHKAPVLCLHLGGDGRLALSGSRDNTVKLWEVAGGQCLRTFSGHEDKVHSVCFTPDGRRFLSGSADQTIKLWEVATGRCLRTFQGHGNGVFSVAVSGDGRYALSGSADRSIKLWKLTLDRCLATLEGHAGPVHSVCLGPDGRWALSGSGDTTLAMWSLPRDPGAPYMISRVLASETILAARTRYDQALARAWQALAGGDAVGAARGVREARSQPGYERQAEAMNQWRGLYLRLARKALSGGWEGSTFKGHLGAVTALAVSVNGRFVLSGGADRTLKLWETATGHCLRTFEGHGGAVTTVCFSADGRHALSGGTDEGLRLWDVASGQSLSTFTGHHDVITAAAMTADGRHVLSASLDRTVKLWEAAGGRCLRTLSGHADAVHSLALSADERYALSGSAQFLIRNENERLFTSGALKLWELASGRCLPTFAGQTDPVTSVSLNRERGLALSGGGKAVLEHQTGRFTQSGQLQLWETASGQALTRFEGHAGAVTSVCLSADGRWALSGSTDKTLRLWETASGQCLRTFQGHADAVTAVVLSGDGRYALSAGADGTVKLWILDWELEDNEPADWDEGALPYLETFLTLQTPYAGALPAARVLKSGQAEEQLTQALTREGKPNWTAEDFERLLYTLGCAGYGWLRPQGVQRKLEQLARKWTGPPEVE